MKKSTRVLSLILAMMMLFSAFSILASAKSVDVAETGATINAGTVFYLKPNSNWTQAGARFAIYFFGSGESWVSMTKDAESGYYTAAAPKSGFTNLIFCRMNPSATANNWNNKWNQTADLTWDGTNNLYTVKSGTWDKGGGTWSFYQAPTEPPTEAPTEEPTEEETTTQAPTQEEETTQAPTQEETTTAPVTENGSNDTWKIVVFTIVGVAVGFGVCFLIFMLKRKNEE